MLNSYFVLSRIAELTAESSERAKSLRNLQICALFACPLRLIILKNCVQSEDFFPGLAQMREKMVAVRETDP